MTTQTLTLTRLRKLENASRIPAVAALLVIMAVHVTTWSARYRTRQRLDQLSDHMLDDIGVSRAEAGVEAQKPFWQP